MATTNPLNTSNQMMYPGGSSTFNEAGGAKPIADVTTPPQTSTTVNTVAQENPVTPTTSTNPIPGVNVAQAGVTNAALTTANQPSTGLVANNVSSLIDQNSPLMQRAAAKAAEQANARGMLNSSMAVGDAQNAVIANALPIASSDAASTNQFALTNAQAANQNSQFNAGASNTLSASNAAAKNAAEMQTQQLGATAVQNTQQQQSQAVQQANQFLQQAASTHDQQITAIMADPNMSTEAKNAAVATLNANYLAFQKSYSALNNMGVTKLLNFGSSAQPLASNAPATPGSNAGYISSLEPAAVASAAAVDKQKQLDDSPQSSTSPTSTYYPKLGYWWNGMSWMPPSGPGNSGISTG